MGRNENLIISVMTRINKAVWEIVGGGPGGWMDRFPGIDPRFIDPKVRLNPGITIGGPRPEPWRFGPSPDPWLPAMQLTAVQLTWRMADAAAAQRDGNAGAELLSSAVDEWVGVEDLLCPLPPRWPIPWPIPDVEPRPPRPEEVRDAATVFAAASISFAHLATTVRDEITKQGLENAAAKTAERAVQLEAT